MVFLTYYLGKEFFSKRIGLLAAVVLSVMFLPVYLSRFITVDMLGLLFLLLTLVYSVRIYLKGGARSYIFAGLFCGFLFGTKFNFLGALPILVAHFFSVRPKKERVFSYLIFSFFTAITSFLITNPFSLLDSKNYWQGIISQILLLKGEEVVSMSDKNGVPSWLWYIKYWFYSGVGLFFISTIAGTIFSLFNIKKSFKKYLLFFCFPFFYTVIIFLSHHRGDRYSLPLMPFFAILSAIFLSTGLDFLNKSVKTSKVKVVFFSLFSLVFIGPAIIKAVMFDYLIGQKDTRILAGEWISQNIPKDQLILADGGSMPTGGYLQNNGFTNMVQGVPFNNKNIFNYPGELILIASWNYREAMNYEKVGEYNKVYENYNLIINKGKLIKEFSIPEFKNEYFAPISLEHSSTVNAYHNPVVQLFEIPEISEEKNLTEREYPASSIINALQVELESDKDSVKDKALLVQPGGEFTAVFDQVIPRGEYEISFLVKRDKDANAKDLTATFEIVRQGEAMVVVQRKVNGRDLLLQTEYSSLEIPLSLKKGGVLAARVSLKGEGRLWIKSIKAVSVN